MKYDIAKIIISSLGLLAGFYTAFSKSKMASKKTAPSILIVAGCLFVSFAVVSLSMLQGHFDPTALGALLTLTNMELSGPQQILTVGYFLILWGLPGLLFRRVPLTIPSRPSAMPALIGKGLRYIFPVVWVALFAYLHNVSKDAGGEEGLFYLFVYIYLAFPLSLVLPYGIRFMDSITHFTNHLSRDTQGLLFTLLFMVVSFVQWYSVIWLISSVLLKKKDKDDELNA